jgi:hypothetical protein
MPGNRLPLDDDALIPDPAIAEDLGITLRSLSDWDRDPNLGFPAPIRIRRRKYRRAGDYRKFKERRAAQAQSPGNAGWAVTRTRPRVRGRFSALGEGNP